VRVRLGTWPAGLDRIPAHVAVSDLQLERDRDTVTGLIDRLLPELPRVLNRGPAVVGVRTTNVGDALVQSHTTLTLTRLPWIAALVVAGIGHLTWARSSFLAQVPGWVPVEADLVAVVEELADFYRPQCDLHRVVLRADLPAAPVVARVDPALVKQALLNLLINATQVMAAQDSGTRELMIRLRTAEGTPPRGARADAPREVAIHVIDTGPGIPAEKHAEIFRPYVTGRKGGSGLGLAVTRRIVEEHGGRIDLFSEPGKGSDFVVRLPLEGPADLSRAAEDDDARKTVLDRLFTRAERQA
jgi:hypothetical protein